MSLIYCQEFHPFTQAKRKLVTHREEERKEEKERNHHNFHLKQMKTTTKETKKTKKETRTWSWSLNQDAINEQPMPLFIGQEKHKMVVDTLMATH